MRTPALSRLLITALACVCFAGSAVGCDDEKLEPTEPEGAYGLFAEALENREPGAVWEYIDQDTKALFKQHYRALVRIDKMISAYFDPAEHRDLRRRTGAALLPEIDALMAEQEIPGGEALYQITFKPKVEVEREGETVFRFSFDEDEAVGMSVDEITIDEEETEATITTRGGQVFVMEKEADGIWRTASLWGPFTEALKPIAISEANLCRYAEDILTEERDRRKAVVDYFWERTGGTQPEGRTRVTRAGSASSCERAILYLEELEREESGEEAPVDGEAAPAEGDGGDAAPAEEAPAEDAPAPPAEGGQ